jgi:paraquat-inducible protein B
MSMRASPSLIGAFVLGALVLLLGGLVLWGGTAMFRPRYRVVMYFDAAVTGLQKGAPVLMRGVRVGEVTDVQMRWGTSLVGVYANLEPDSLKGVPPRDLQSAIRQAAEDRHLRAQLRMQSFVTGVLYVALDEFPGTPIVLRKLDPAVLELPTVPTDIEKWTAKIEKIADALAALPLDEIGRSVIATLDEARRILKSPEVASSLKNLDAVLAETRGLVRRVDTLAANVNTQVGPLSTDAQAALVSAQGALAQVPALVQDVRRVVAKLDAHVDPLLTSLQKTSDTAGNTLERAQATLAGVDGTLSQDSALGSELGRALVEVREAARALGSLADYLERNPDALVYGRRHVGNGR